ncbi:MAG: NAD(+) synthase, partial [Leptospiraceae bacterium]|nr:NAD(+) synthase [Leptospiraceae bacterium]
MKKIKISTISLKTTPLDIEGNRRNIINALQDKQVENSGIILFPELCLTGYGCEDAFYNSHLWKDAMTSLIKILPHTVGKFVVVGLPVFLSPYLYNCAAVICDGKIAGFIPKQNLANTGIHYEKRWFKEGFNEHELVSYYDMHIPFGNYLFELGDVIIGVEICEDSWVMNRTSHLHSQNGANIILSSGASHFSLGKHEIRRQIFLESSRNQNNIFVYSNLNGNEAGKVVFDAGCMVCQNGELLSEGKRYHMSDYEILNTVVDIDLNHHNRSRYFRDSYYDKTKPIRIIQLEYELEDTQEDLNRPIAVQDEDPFEAFSEVVSLGLFDYMRKTKTKGYTLSLSGGADSAACA